MKTIKKIAAWTAGIFIILAAVLFIHIYMVTRPGKADANTISMARIDIEKNFTQEEADMFTRWLYSQNGVEHVMSNITNHNIVFAYKPVLVNADDVAKQFAASFKLDAKRYKPSKEEMMSGCPAGVSNKEGVAGLFSGVFR